MQSGIGPDLFSMAQIKELQRPVKIPDSGIFYMLLFIFNTLGMLTDLLWSNPSEETQGWSESDRGVSVNYSMDVFEKFLENFKLKMLIRSSTVSTLFLILFNIF